MSKRFVPFVAVALVLSFASAGTAYAYFTSSSTGTGTASVGKIAAPAHFISSPVGSTSVKLSWTAPSTPTETGYTLAQSPGALHGCSATPVAGATTCTASTLTAGDSYTWTLRAVDSTWTSTPVQTTGAGATAPGCQQASKLTLKPGQTDDFRLVGGGGGNGAGTTGGGKGGTGAPGTEVTGKLTNTTHKAVALTILVGCKGTAASGSTMGLQGAGHDNGGNGGNGGTGKNKGHSGGGGGGGGASSAIAIGATTLVVAGGGGGGGGAGGGHNGATGTTQTTPGRSVKAGKSGTGKPGAAGTSKAQNGGGGAGGGGGGVMPGNLTASAGGPTMEGAGGGGGYSFGSTGCSGVVLTDLSISKGGNPGATGSVAFTPAVPSVSPPLTTPPGTAANPVGPTSTPAPSVTSAAQIAGIELVTTALSSGSINCGTSSRADVTCSLAGLAPPGDFTTKVALVAVTGKPVVNGTGAPIVVTATGSTVTPPGTKVTATVPTGASTTSSGFTVAGTGTPWSAKVTFSVTLGDRTFAVTLTAS